jgi:predicted RNase H-like nuclease (RuvC/YqgF family)
MKVDVQQIAPSVENEAIVAELAETAELQARKLVSLNEEVEQARREHRQLSTELHMARAWIRELAAELERADPPSEPDRFTLRGRIYAP